MLTGIIGSGQIGRDPFDRRAWSGSSYHFFNELRRRGALHRALGVEAPALLRYLLLAKHFHPKREIWRNRFYLDRTYRDLLTREVRNRLSKEDMNHDVLQIGAFYDAPSILAGRRRCYSYHDGNLASWIGNSYASKGLPKRLIDRALEYEVNVARHTDIVFTMSKYLRRSFVKDYGLAESQVVAVGAGLNFGEIPAPSPHKRYDTGALLFVGVEFERKGGWILLEAFARARRRFPHAILHIVGPDAIEIPTRLATGVVRHGYLSRSSTEEAARLALLFESCCIFVMPSLFEPFGIAPIEAMAHQLPAILTKDWALEEIVEPGVTGFLAAAGDVDDLSDKLEEALADPGRLREMGEKARASVVDYYNWPAVVGRILDAIANVSG